MPTKRMTVYEQRKYIVNLPDQADRELAKEKALKRVAQYTLESKENLKVEELTNGDLQITANMQVATMDL